MPSWGICRRLSASAIETASQVMHFGGAWRFTRVQQIDCHAGFGFGPASPKSYFGLGYSLVGGRAVLTKCRAAAYKSPAGERRVAGI